MEKQCYTKQKILAAAKKLFAKRGYACTTLDDIAAKVSIAKPSLFYHFKNKERIYADVVKDSLSTIIKDLERYLEESGSKTETLERIVGEVIEKRLNDETVIRLVDMNIIGLDQKTFTKIRLTLQKIHELTQKILESLGVKDPDLAAEVLINAIHCYVLHANSNLSAVDPKRYGKYLASLFVEKTLKLVRSDNT